MKNQRSIFLLCIICIILLVGCSQTSAATVTSTQEIPKSNTPEPTQTSTTTPTITSTPEFYTEEERNAEGKVWVAEEYFMPGFSIDWKSASCLPLPPELAGEMSQSTLHLSQPGGKLAFDHNVYTRVLPNLWINEPNSAEVEYSTEGLSSQTLEISIDQIIVTTTLITTTNEEVTCVNQYTLQSDDPSSIPTFTKTAVTIGQKIEMTPGFYTEDEISAQGKTWTVDFYQTAQLYTTGFSHCKYYEDESGEFSRTLGFVLPNPDEDLVIGEARYSRISPNVWEQVLPAVPYGFQVTITLEFSNDRIVETMTVLSQINGTTICINEYHAID